MLSDILKKQVKEYLDREISEGKAKTYFYCKCIDDITLHVFKGEGDGREYWTCYECGSTSLKKLKKDI